MVMPKFLNYIFIVNGYRTGYQVSCILQQYTGLDSTLREAETQSPLFIRAPVIKITN